MLPAYAGMILETCHMFVERFCAPRVCGDDPIFEGQGFGVDVCSPRMRG